MMELTINKNENTEVLVLDEPGQGGACHAYIIQPKNGEQNPPFAQIHFQEGPIKEFGVNGCQQEDLLAIVIHRLESFQAGEFACVENQAALIHVKGALSWLQARTMARQKRGVEGTNIK